MAVIDFLINNIFMSAATILGLVALIGLIIQKKPAAEVASGTLKTMMGMMILSAGASVICGSLEYFSVWFAKGLHIDGAVASIEAVLAVAMQDATIGRDIALAYVLIFVVNIILARVTPLKYVFMNGEAPIYIAMSGILFGVGLLGFGHSTAIVIAGILGGIWCLIWPALAQKSVRKITGSDDIALGHFCTLGYLLAGFVGKITGKEEDSTENTQVSTKFAWLQDTYMAIAVVMIPVYVILAILAGPDCGVDCGNMNYIFFAFIQAITFCVGIFILLTGVRMLIEELVPAFKGIAEKVVPGARPCLDCPVLFPFAPNAVVYGFIFTTIGTIIGMFLWPVFGLPMVIPSIMSNFFAGGTAGIFANAWGGRRGCIIGSIVHGLFISLLPAIIAPYLGSIDIAAIGSLASYTMTDVDCISFSLVYSWIIKLFVH